MAKMMENGRRMFIESQEAKEARLAAETKAKQEKELEKQQELSRIQMNKELNEVS